MTLGVVGWYCAPSMLGAEQNAARLRETIRIASRGLVEREVLVELVVLAAVAREHVLVIGPPGTAKSEAARRISRALGGRYFEYLLGRFTEPSEIFGPVDLQKLRGGVVETQTAGMLPEADIVFLDEVFRGSTAILNTLLGILNERKFRRGKTVMDCPLQVCVGASNGLPEDESLAAFSDRFLVQVFLEPVPDPQLEELLRGGWELAETPSAQSELRAVAQLAQVAERVAMKRVQPLMADAIRTLRRGDIQLSDRRCVRAQRLVAAAATLDGRTQATPADLWPLIYAVPTATGQATARELLRDQLEAARSAALPAAAEDASMGPLARAARIAERGEQVLGDSPGPDASRSSWHLKLEGIAREIDSSFPADSMPERLSSLRERILAELREKP
jgi:MoxR-like ATPase